MLIKLPARPPFSFYHVVRSHGWYQLAPFRADEQAVTLTYVDRLHAGRVVELLMQQSGDGIAVETSTSLSQVEQEEVVHQVTWMFGLDQDFSSFYALAQNEPKLQKSVEAARGRVLRSPTLFEDVVKTILTTNTVWGGTKRMVQLLVDNYGDPLPADPTRKAFPTPERLSELDVDSLRQVVRVGYRAPYVLELARRAASGELNLEALKTAPLSTAELRKRLMMIKGVGAYAAANLLMILGRYDFIPVDSWALKVVSHEWHNDQPIGAAEVEAAFEHWGAWKGLAYWFWDWSLFSQA